MNEVQPAGSALLTVVFAAVMFVVGHLYTENRSAENSGAARRSSVHAIDKPFRRERPIGALPASQKVLSQQCAPASVRPVSVLSPPSAHSIIFWRYIGAPCGPRLPSEGIGMPVPARLPYLPRCACQTCPQSYFGLCPCGARS